MRSASIHTLKSWDGAELTYRAWLPAKPTERALMLFHRGHEHSARWQETVEALNLDDVAIFAWDQRGHGASPGERGSAAHMGVFLRDAEAFSRHLMAQHGVRMENTVVMAHSVGAVVASAWVHDYAPPIRGLILGAPAFRVKLYVPLAIPLLRLKEKLFGKGYVKSYVKARMLTHDPEQAAAYQADPSIFRQISVRILLDLHDTATRLIADAGAFTAPLLIMAAGDDWVVKVAPQKQFFDRASSATKHFEVLPGFYHAIFHEQQRSIVVSRARAFIEECFARPYDPPALVEADRRGYTKDEYDRLSAPGGLTWAVTRAALKTVGRLSRGIDIGWRYGFDSGIMLDYVYENQPRGVTILGRMIDRAYLNSPGWSGIRMRRANLEAALERTVRDLHAAGKPVRILDIAAGGGRYVVETIRRLKAIPVTAVLRDYKPENIAAIRQLAGHLAVSGIEVLQADAFDRASLAATQPRPTLAIVSGLYELFPENARLQTSLAGLADAVEPGGYLVYTNQPWHPQVEFIARVLRNREGRPWVMRRRTQAEMDQLVRQAGFDKISEEIDPWGIFSVSVARRKSA